MYHQRFTISNNLRHLCSKWALISGYFEPITLKSSNFLLILLATPGVPSQASVYNLATYTHTLTMLIVYIGDRLLQTSDFLLQQGLQVRLILAIGDSCQFFILLTLLIGHHHPKILPASKSKYLRWLLSDCL